MKILYLITKSNFGGAQRYVCDLSIEAKNVGYDVTVAAGGHGELANKIEDESIPYVEIEGLGRDVNIKNDIKSFFSIWKIIKKESPDVVHFNSSKMGLGILAARIQKILFKKPNSIIFTAHGWPFHEPRSFWQVKLIWLLSWLSMILSDKTITVAPYDYETGRKMPFSSKTLRYVPNGIAKIKFYPRDSVREKIEGMIGKEDVSNKRLSITVAELNKNKGISYLIEAAQDFKEKDIIFLVAGDGDDRDYLKKLIEEKNMSQFFFLLGKVPDVKNLLKGFDMFILPSVKEGLPYSLLEAGLAELPSIATSVGGTTEIIEDMESGILVRRKDSKELGRAIDYLLENKKQSIIFAKKLKDKVEKDFGLSRMISQTFKLYT